MSHRQHRVENATMSFAVTMPQEFSNTASYHTGATSSGAQSLSQSGTNCDWGVQGCATILPLLPPSNTQSLDKTFPPHDLVSTGKDSALQDIALGSLVPIPEARVQEPRPIRAKPVASPSDTLINNDSDDATGRTPRRRGRKRPLDANTKEGAAFMRKMHACAHCFVNNLKVSLDEPCQRLD
jgi:hypothetical protein